ncbi:MAG: hypothetical protein QM642_04245 [Edaphocola sp.]
MSIDSLNDPATTLPKPKRKKEDNALLGLLVGLLFPLLAVLVLYFVWSGHTSLTDYLGMFASFDSPWKLNEASKILSLATISNLVPFYFFLNRKCYQTTRGILVSMFLLGVLFVLYKFVWQ